MENILVEIKNPAEKISIYECSEKFGISLEEAKKHEIDGVVSIGFMEWSSIL